MACEITNTMFCVYLAGRETWLNPTPYLAYRFPKTMMVNTENTDYYFWARSRGTCSQFLKNKR